MRLAENLECFAAAQLLAGFGGFTVDKYVALIHEELNAGAAHAIELRSEKNIQPLAGRFRWNGKGAAVSHGFPRDAVYVLAG